MSTALFTHPDCLLHENGPGHVESPDRLRAVLAELATPDFTKLKRYEAPLATVKQLARVHDRAYVENILSRVPSPELGQAFIALDPDTSLSSGSGEAALRAAGAVVAAVDEVLGGSSTNAFCAVRPPGHHAEYARAMGFCLFDNIAVGAAQARAVHNTGRIAIIDFDVHHGNGTQEWAQRQDDILFISSHLFPFFPGTGSGGERGPKGNIVNIPLAAGDGSVRFRDVARDIMLPALDAFRPELIMISAGFDAHKDDPIGQMRLTEDDYGWITQELVKHAARLCRGAIVSVLEGGYDLRALAASAGAHVKALLAA